MSGTDLTLDKVQETFGQLATTKELFYDWEGLNTWLFTLINSLHGESYDAFMLYVTQLGSHRFFPVYLGLLALYAVLAGVCYKLRRKGGVRMHFIMWFGACLVLIASSFVNLVIIGGVKDYFQYPRPYAAEISGYQPVVVSATEGNDPYHSFPSGHTAFITLIVASLWPVLSPNMRLFGAFLIFLVGWSRVSLGVHFPADAVGAVLITSAVVITMRWLIYKVLRILGINCGGG